MLYVASVSDKQGIEQSDALPLQVTKRTAICSAQLAAVLLSLMICLSLADSDSLKKKFHDANGLGILLGAAVGRCSHVYPAQYCAVHIKQQRPDTQASLMIFTGAVKV